jgi:hypothetical protein
VKPTQATNLIALAIAGGALMYAVEVIVVRQGQLLVLPPVTLAVALALLGIILPLLAWPIRQSARGDSPRPPVNPFYATRVLLIAKAGSVTASVLTGAAVGVLAFVLGRMVLIWPHVFVTSFTLIGGVLMVVGALVAERWCVIPPGDEAESSAVPEGEPA